MRKQDHSEEKQSELKYINKKTHEVAGTNQSYKLRNTNNNLT